MEERVLQEKKNDSGKTARQNVTAVDRLNNNFTFCQYHTNIQLMLPNDLRVVNMFIRRLRVTSV